MTTAAPLTVLQHKYISQAGKEQGSISASIFTSEDGQSAGRWRAAPVYKPTCMTEAKADGQPYARYEGYIESRPGVYFGIVLQWRSKDGTLTKLWQLDDDLVAYYYLDGRALPCMKYAICQPGGKNPLPLSGLWPANDTRYPLRWEKRCTAADSVELDDSLFTSSNETCPVLPPLCSEDDLGSIRITIHHKTEEESSRYGRFDGTPMPYNIGLGSDVDLKTFRNSNVTESIGFQTPADVSEEQLQDIYSGREAPPKSLPFLEFRLYYKHKDSLTRLGVLGDLDSLGPVARTSNGSTGSLNGQVTQSAPTLTNGHPSTPEPLKKRPRPSETGTNVPRNGSRADTPQPLLPLLAPVSVEAPPLTTNSIASTSRSTLDDVVPPASKRVKLEPSSSPNRSRALAIPALETEGRSTSAEGDHQQLYQQHQNTMPDDARNSLPPPLATISRQSSSSEVLNPPAAPPVAEERRSTPSTSASSAPLKAEKASLRVPTLAQRAAINFDSPMPSQSQNSCFGNTSQSAAREARALQAEAFLAEEDLDIAEPENVHALISVGFRTKKKFLSRLPNCDPGTRDKIFAHLSAQMEPLDWGVLKNYLMKNCGL